MSWTKPTDKDVANALPLISSPQHEAYFFTRLANPLWITPLAERRVFSAPPQTQVLADGGRRFPLWPASRYLARMAKDAPGEAAAIMRTFDTNNPSVIADVITASLAMPPHIAATLTPKIAVAAREELLWTHFLDAANLCVYLAAGAEWHAAFDLAESMFGEASARTPLGRRDEYLHAEGLKTILPVFVAGRPLDLITRIGTWLARQVRASPEDGDQYDDHSWSWRPAIEEHEQNHDRRWASVLTGILREAAETALKRSQVSLEDIVVPLRAHRLLLFDRIAMYLIGEHAPLGDEPARLILQDRAMFDDFRFKHEYVLLLKRHFAHLPPADTEHWLGWVDAGPDMAAFESSFQFRHSRAASADERERYRDHWKFGKLYAVQATLHGDRYEFYQSMLSRHGIPELADMNVTMSSRYGHESPILLEDLEGQTLEDVTRLVMAWTPKPDASPWGPNFEGLVSTFRQFVAKNVEVCADRSSAIEGARCELVYAFLSQMAQALRDGRVIRIHSLIRLCQWVVAQPVSARDPEVVGDGMVLHDSGWQWCRDECARIVEAVCRTERGTAVSEEAKNLREMIWGIVGALSHDPAISYLVESEAPRDPPTKDYCSLALNSSRAVVLAAALEYAHWVARESADDLPRHGARGVGMEKIPEVREVLEWHLDNPSVSAFAAIGLRTALLCWLDERWVADKAGVLFGIGMNVDKPGPEVAWAAWNTFIVGTRPHITYYRVLQPQFVAAVAQAAAPRSLLAGDSGPLFSLAEHLALLYARGELNLDADNQLLGVFLSSAQPAIRRHAIEFLGRVLQSEGPIPQDVIERLTVLWSRYWVGAGREDAAEMPGAYLFGAWFATGRFDQEWSLSRLEEFVQVVGLPQPDHAVAERLAQIADAEPLRVMRVLQRMVDADVEGWHLYGWAASARSILQSALEAGGASEVIARGTINSLGRRGVLEFGKLLK